MARFFNAHKNSRTWLAASAKSFVPDIIIIMRIDDNNYYFTTWCPWNAINILLSMLQETWVHLIIDC